MTYGAARAKRRGVVAVFAAISMVVIVSVVAIVMDSGMVRDRRRHVQGAVDAAALAGAIELFHDYRSVSAANPDPGGRALAAALANLQDNGYTAANSEIHINIPPTQSRSDFNGQTGLVEVIVSMELERKFSTVLGSGGIPVEARAIARGSYPQVNDGVLVLDPDTRGSLNAHGNGNVFVQGADVLVNSNHSEAAVTNGQGVSAVDPNPLDNFVPGFKITGGHVGGGFSPVPVTGVKPTADPLRFLPPPDKSALPVGSYSTSNGVTTMQAGYYADSVLFSGTDNVVMSEGVYYFDQGFKVTGQANVTGLGVMLYNDPHSSTHQIELAGNGTVTLSPMGTGVYAGISIYQNRRADVDLKITGNGRFNVEGTIYAANGLVMIEGNGDVSIGSRYVSRMLDLGGNGDVNILPPRAPPPRTRQIEIVE